MSLLSYSLTRSVAPTSEPITRAEAKTHMRVSGTDDDSYIDALIEVARRQFEHDARVAVITQTWVLKLHGFPLSDVIELRIGPVASVSNITYVDLAGSTQTFSDWTADTSRGVVWLDYQKQWPSTRDTFDAVSITFVAGASSADEAQKQAIKFLVAHWFENRQPISDVHAYYETPMAYQVLVSQMHPGSYP